jgi:drug/metabolite transporter (DMT)-like permease
MRKGFGVGFAIIGAATAIGHGVEINGQVWRGDLLMIAATFLGAIYAVFSRPYVQKYSPLTVTAIAMGAGAAGLLVLWLTLDFPMGFPKLDLAGWASIYYIGIAGGALSFFLYAWALGRTTATTMMIFLPLNPISALIAGGLFLREPLSVELFLGLILVVIGIILVIGMNGGAAKQPTPGPVL